MTMTTEKTYEGFVQFVNEQPADRVIKHNVGWEGCAVGEYLGDGESSLSCARWVKDNLPANVLRLLSFPPYAKIVGNTYGQLAKYLNSVQES